MPAIIHAKEGDIAENVVICGDPARAESLSGMLNKPRLVNVDRGFIIYTGKFNGSPITIATHGIGQPSVAIVIEELAQLGAKRMLRLGTAGALDEKIKTGEFVVVTGASYANGSTVTQYEGKKLDGIAIAQTPDFELTAKITEELDRKKLAYRFSNTYSSDSFYSFRTDFAKELAVYGNDVVDMEVSTLFMLGKIKRLSTASLLVVSNNVIKDTKMLSHAELEGRVKLAASVAFNALQSK
jgi:5'-methylthioadenosine phosphorylase